MPHPSVDPGDLQSVRAEQLLFYLPTSPAQQDRFAARRLPQAQKLELIALQERDIQQADGQEMQDEDDLPEPVRIDE